MNTWGGGKSYLKIKDNAGIGTNGCKLAMHTFRLRIVRFLALRALELCEGLPMGLGRPKTMLTLRVRHIYCNDCRIWLPGRARSWTRSPGECPEVLRAAPSAGVLANQSQQGGEELED